MLISAYNQVHDFILHVFPCKILSFAQFTSILLFKQNSILKSHRFLKSQFWGHCEEVKAIIKHSLNSYNLRFPSKITTNSRTVEKKHRFICIDMTIAFAQYSANSSMVVIMCTTTMVHTTARYTQSQCQILLNHIWTDEREFKKKKKTNSLTYHRSVICVQLCLPHHSHRRVMLSCANIQSNGAKQTQWLNKRDGEQFAAIIESLVGHLLTICTLSQQILLKLRSEQINS